MILAKISPTAKFNKQQASPFEDAQVIEANVMTAFARPYILGAKKTRFEVKFGKVTFAEDGLTVVTKDLNVGSISNVELTADEMKDWGTDDSKILPIIASKVGTKVTGTFSIEDSNGLGF